MVEQTRSAERQTTEPSRRPLATASVGTVLIALAAALVLMAASSVRESVRSVESTLPCEPALINHGVSIDPRGYSLYSNEMVEQSKALDACMAESRRLIESGDMVIAEVAKPIATAIVGIFLAFLFLIGWIALVAGSASRRRMIGMGLITVVAVASFAAQLRHGEVLEAIGWITN